MKTAEIKKAVTRYFNSLDKKELRVQHNIVRGALEDLLFNKDTYHLQNLHELLVEMKNSPEYKQTEKNLGNLDSAITTVTNELER